MSKQRESQQDQRSSTLEGLPLDLKIEILRSLDSIYDLEALGHTCRVFYGICSSPKYRAVIYRQLLSYGEHGGLLRGLAVLRAYGRDNQLGLLKDADGFPGNNPTDNTKYINKLLSYRKTTRWFTNRFFEKMASRYGEYPPDSPKNDESKAMRRFIPSRTETENLDNAFLVFWMFAETIYIYENRKPWGVVDGCTKDEQINSDDSREAFAYSILWLIMGVDEEFQLQIPANFAILYSVALFLSELTTPMALRHAETISYENVKTIASEIGCPDVYNRRGISNLLLWNLGLNGLQEFLEADKPTQESTIGKYYYRPVEHGLGRDLDVADLYGIYISCFSLIIEEVWGYMRHSSKNMNYLRSRPLWKDSGVFHLLSVAPWNQLDEFDIDAVFCDDERLERLGYFRPVMSIYGDESAQNSLEVKMKLWVCQCKDDWGCWD
ncbi:hypothetical protein TWF730_005803 [Orbilia blumenaviensis]|uniref:F-box domain-containing protein n=1 Tax=Orbilia blumenaviensis TaxID=1796055 RepID=A0AAV9VQN2_9PEZI